jgi:hypothetical protein
MITCRFLLNLVVETQKGPPLNSGCFSQRQQETIVFFFSFSIAGLLIRLPLHLLNQSGTYLQSRFDGLFINQNKNTQSNKWPKPGEMKNLSGIFFCNGFSSITEAHFRFFTSALVGK